VFCVTEGIAALLGGLADVSGGEAWRLEPGAGKRTVYIALKRNEETRRDTASIELTQETVVSTTSPSRSR